MTSLADRVIAAQKEPSSKSQFHFLNYELPEKDENGMPIVDSIEYIIARIIYIDYHLSGRERLHLREDGRIWEGDHWLAENDSNLYRITRWPYRAFTKDQKTRIWNKLKEILPMLSYEKIVVKDNLVWDAEKNELYFSEEPPLTMN